MIEESNKSNGQPKIKPLVLIGFLVGGIIASVGFTYWNIMTRKDFIIINDLERNIPVKGGTEILK